MGCVVLATLPIVSIAVDINSLKSRTKSASKYLPSSNKSNHIAIADILLYQNYIWIWLFIRAIMTKCQIAIQIYNIIKFPSIVQKTPTIQFLWMYLNNMTIALVLMIHSCFVCPYCHLVLYPFGEWNSWSDKLWNVESMCQCFMIRGHVLYNFHWTSSSKSGGSQYILWISIQRRPK